MMALAGGLAAAHIGDDDIVADGLGFASKRRTYLRGPGHGPMSAELLVSIHINDVRFLDGGQAATSAATQAPWRKKPARLSWWRLSPPPAFRRP
jgi:hypothetical protein